MTWALSADVGDATRKLVLIGYANHAHKDGRNSWASKATIADYVNCHPKTVTRHVQALIEDGWLREGDQQQVAHLRADRRPVVYDLAMTDAQRDTWRGDNLSPRDDDTTGQPVPPSEVHGGTHGGTPVSERGDTAVSHKPYGTSELPPTPRRAGEPGRRGPSPVRCSRHGDTPGDNCRRCGTTARQVAAQERAAAREAARLADAAAIAEQRASAAAARDQWDSPAVRAAREEARQAARRAQLAGSTR